MGSRPSPLGLGETVVTGGACFQFCPRYPRHIVAVFVRARHAGQRAARLLALELGPRQLERRLRRRCSISKPPRKTGRWQRSAPRFSGNDVVYDGISRPGVRLVTFAPMLKHGLFPLAELVDTLLRMCVKGTGVPVEVEFAVHLPGRGLEPEFGVLQLRPLGRVREVHGPICRAWRATG